MSFTLTPEYFLLAIVLGVLFIILMCGAVYVCGYYHFEGLHLNSRSNPLPADFGNPTTPRPIGTGFYTTPSLDTPVCFDTLGMDQFASPEWISGYLYGLHQQIGNAPNESTDDDNYNSSVENPTSYAGASNEQIMVRWDTDTSHNSYHQFACGEGNVHCGDDPGHESSMFDFDAGGDAAAF